MYHICRYKREDELQWDDFVMNKSVNGTFLQTRRFLNYHPNNRFIDASILIFDKGKIAGVCPACEIYEMNKKVFFSHKGATFGGLIVNPKYYFAEKIIEMIECVEKYLYAENYIKIIFKNTPDIFCKEGGSLLDYSLFYLGYKSYSELSTYIDLYNLSDNVVDSFDRNKKRNIEKCLHEDLEFRMLSDDYEVEQFYALLTKNLQKYNLKPIHSLSEIKDFHFSRLKTETRFYGIFKNEKEIAGGMMFIFEQTNTIHAQNLSADYTFKEYSPITFLYYKVIEQAKKDGFSKLSWGISTENEGKHLNMTLIRNKESYGSKYALNYTYYKEIR